MNNSIDLNKEESLDNRAFQNQLVRIVSIPVVFILILLVFFHFQNSYRDKLASQIRNIKSVRLALVRLEKNFSDIENGLRGYVLSGKPAFYQSTLNAIGRVEPLSERIFELLVADVESNKEFRDILDKHDKYETHVLETMALRKEELKNSEELAESALVSGRHNFLTVKKAIIKFESRLAARGESLSEALALTIRNTSLIEVAFTLLLAFFVVFIMIRQLKKMTKNNRLLLQKNMESMKQIQDSAKTKDLFLANMSHEIRTPLGAILGFAALLQKDESLKGETKSHISFIKRNSEHLLGLIDDLFDLSRLSADKLEIDYEEQNLAQLIRDLENNFSSKVFDKKIDLDIRLDTRIPEIVETDPVRLTQIITNLVGNAIKFSPAKSVINVIFSYANDRLQIDVIDQGIGIDPSVQSIIFDAFSQADSEHSRRFGGAGLGLSISKKLAQALRGELTLVSSELEKGSHFRLVIPCIAKNQSYLNLSSLDEQANEIVEDNASIEISDFNFSSKRVLLAEDSKENQILFKIFIESTKADLRIVDNGTDAVREALSKDYDLILMDIQMPGLDGYEAVNILRGSSYKKKIIALTAHTMKGEKEKCLESGFDGYISKPVTQEKLLQVMGQTMSLQQPIH